MFIRILMGVLFIFGVSGCATTQNKSQGDPLQTRVADLEKKLEEKDSEIVDLQYEVKDLSSKVSSNAAEPASSAGEKTSAPSVSVRGGDDIIKVNASVEKVQTALKNAGFYNGKVDGKIGAGTKSAIVDFQKSKGLNADGKVGRKTWEALKQNLK